MRVCGVVLLALGSSSLVWAQGSLHPLGKAPPTLAETRRDMGIASTDTLRGQVDSVGYASRPEQMAAVWKLAAEPPAPETFGALPSPGVSGVICPHDDYIYAARVYRRVLPLVTAKTVIIVGVFHGYRRFLAHDRIVFDPYSAWRSPDGDIAISPLRDALFAALPDDTRARDAASHDSEHSVEAIAYWLKHQRPDVELVPLIMPVATFPRLTAMASQLGAALAAAMKQRGLALGKDVAIVISSDGEHYGRDFSYTPFGDGGVDALTRALAQDRALITHTLAGPVSAESARAFFAATVNPDDPNQYRNTWCGRFSVPFGLLLLGETTRALGLPPPIGVPIALSASVNVPELPLRPLGLGPTAPANLYHFVMHPAVAFVPR